MFQERDGKVVLAVGRHKALSGRQIQELYFPSYQTRQGRLRKELIPNKYLSQPFYINVDSNGKRTPIYRLDKEGICYYENATGKKYRCPKWSLNYIPHLVELNRILIRLYGVIESFSLEEQIGSIRADAWVKTKEGKVVALELDYSESEKKQEIVKQIKSYEGLYMKKRKPDMLVWLSKRKGKLLGWYEDMAVTDLPVVFCGREKDNLNRLMLTL